ncbi:MAG TPA: 2-C-methyl-D-erythritol 4-phosphate cytidylyltransferase [Clostridiales bacterium]|nr:2-C-methyl-D-erythritol 4-phosphate cytidylyltransferase [Clostridiales bacterium]
MNIALILAGGVDPKFHMEIPKQFVSVYNRPIITYTMEVFQMNPEIDYIAVACLNGWQELVKSYAKQFNISKLRWLVMGGIRGQDSSYNGINALYKDCNPDDLIIIHDSIRPLVSNEIISDSIKTCKKNGMGVAAVCSMDTIMRSSDGKTGDESINRYEVMRVQTPQTYPLKYLYEAHQLAIEKGIKGNVDTNSMISKLGRKIYFSKGADINLKINTVEDVEMFKALYKIRNDKAE